MVNRYQHSQRSGQITKRARWGLSPSRSESALAVSDRHQIQPES